LFNWLQKAQSKKLTGIVQQSEGLAFACISQDKTGEKPHLDECIFQPQLSDLKTTLNQLLQQAKQIASPVTTLLSSNHFTLLLMQRPTVEDNELIDAIRWQIKDQLNYPPQEAIIQILDIPGQQERGRLPMIYAIAAHQDTIKSSIELIEDSKLKLRYVDIPELAQRNISALLPEDFIGVALLNLQAGHGLLTITHEGELYLSRVIDIGYEHLEEAEQNPQSNNGLSLEETSSEHDNNISKIVLEIQRSLDYYESHYGKPTIGNLIIAPLETDIPNLNRQLEDDLGLVVRSLDLDEIISSDSKVDLELQAKCFSAIGSALRQVVEISTDSKFE